MIAALCFVALFGVAGWFTFDLAGDNIAGAFRDALNALNEFLR